MYISLIILLSAALTVLSIISVVKNFLINFNVSDNGWKTALMALLIVVCLTCAIFSYIEAYGIREIKDMQPSPQFSQAQIEQLRLLIPMKTANVTKAIGIGAATYILHILMIRNAKEARRKAAEANAQYRWANRV